MEPDLIITFSDVQASLAAELMRRGFAVLATNQRTMAAIETTLALFGWIVGREREAERLFRPRVYFEEWNDPLIAETAN